MSFLALVAVTAGMAMGAGMVSTPAAAAINAPRKVSISAGSSLVFRVDGTRIWANVNPGGENEILGLGYRG